MSPTSAGVTPTLEEVQRMDGAAQERVAAGLVGHVSDDNIGVLLALLREAKSPRAEFWAVNAAGCAQHHADTVLPLLAEALGDHCRGVELRKSVCHNIAKLPGTVLYIPALFAVYRDFSRRSDPSLREAAGQAIAQLLTRDDVAVPCEMLEQMGVLRVQGDSPAAALLRTLLEDRLSIGVLTAAVMACQQLPVDQLRPLGGVLHDVLTRFGSGEGNTLREAIEAALSRLEPITA